MTAGLRRFQFEPSHAHVWVYGPALLGILLVVAYVFVGRDPATPID